MKDIARVRLSRLCEHTSTNSSHLFHAATAWHDRMKLAAFIILSFLSNEAVCFATQPCQAFIRWNFMKNAAAVASFSRLSVSST